MLKHILPALAVVALSASSVAAQTAMPAAPGVSLVIKDGKVTLKAEAASVRQILAEWERQGQIKVVGAEKLAGAPVTLTLVDIPEKQALEIVMRGVPGYMAIDRVAQADAASVGPSRYDRVVVMARATTPVAAAPAGASAAGRGMPSPAQPPTAFQQTMPEPMPQAFAPPVGDEGVVAAGPDRNDVDQFQQNEPPMPEAPVASPSPNAYPGSPYIGANVNSGPYGGNPAAAAAAGMTGAPPETQFDYANPQKYFEQRRLQQQGQQPTSVPTAVPTMGTPIGTTGRTPMPQPSGVPTAPGVLAQPGIAPVPQAAPTPAQGEFFNPYNLPADWVPPPAVPTSGTPVEPDRAKYSNPYNPSQPPE